MKNCVNCIFLAAEKESNLSEVRREERVMIQRENRINSFVGITEYFKCYHNIWSQSSLPSNPTIANILIMKERGNTCFFYEYQENVLFPGAVKLQEQKAKNESMRKQFYLSTIGLWIAGISLLANAVLGIIRLAIGK